MALGSEPMSRVEPFDEALVRSMFAVAVDDEPASPRTET
jgi:hypothetical protein